ncbi:MULTISPECIES: RHS repeat-associated core domain-containing protein [unclassified Allomuricauda]|uniref:RHS repeat-associated core domain-containing protein n=2 Tax=unclassified Allomuricauda TaxID=2615049 RepID=UPI00273FDCEE|nr:MULTISPECIES: RHS repeat-associated core domain-containing protein [unclassified Allomuricauda]
MGNVRAVFGTEGNEVGLKGFTDYYPGGMAMPNRNLEDTNGYRYGYQGQFAEEDKETGLNAFQLRMYDSRINRWLSPDPYGQYNSPYLAMGNDWANGVDPDGGWKTKFGAWLWKTFNGGGEIVGEKGNWSVAQQGPDGWDTFVTNGSFKTSWEKDNPWWTRLNTQQQYSYPKTEFYVEAQADFNVGGIGADVRAFGSTFALFGEAGRNPIYSIGGGYNTETGPIDHTFAGLPEDPNQDFGLSVGKGLGAGVNFNNELSINKVTYSAGLTNLIIEYHTEDTHKGQTKIKSVSSEQEFGGSINFIYGIEAYIKFGVKQTNE